MSGSTYQEKDWYVEFLDLWKLGYGNARATVS
jgi:hypothetical protein